MNMCLINNKVKQTKGRKAMKQHTQKNSIKEMNQNSQGSVIFFCNKRVSVCHSSSLDCVVHNQIYVYVQQQNRSTNHSISLIQPYTTHFVAFVFLFFSVFFWFQIKVPFCDLFIIIIMIFVIHVLNMLFCFLFFSFRGRVFVNILSNFNETELMYLHNIFPFVS